MATINKVLRSAKRALAVSEAAIGTKCMEGKVNQVGDMYYNDQLLHAVTDLLRYISSGSAPSDIEVQADKVDRYTKIVDDCMLSTFDDYESGGGLW